MKRIKSVISKWQNVILITLVSITAYGLLIPWLHYYMDDWGFAYLYETQGFAGLTDYFAFNRPLWGMLFKLEEVFLQNNLILFHLFGLFWRIIASLSFFWLISLLWPQKKNFTLTAALLFAVYPGFLVQPMALTFGNIWVIYTFFLVSNCFTLLAIQKTERRTAYTIVAVVFSLLNISIMEYFLPLEIIRLAFLFLAVSGNSGFWPRLLKALRYWIPYFACLMAVTIYRAFFYQDQTHIYSLGLVDVFRTSFINGLNQLIQSVGSALYQSVVVAWVQPYKSLAAHFGTSMTFLAVFAITIVVVVGLKIILKRSQQSQTSKFQWSPLIIGILALLPAGVPFYITSLQVKPTGVNSRFTMPFMIGAVLILAFILDLIPQKWVKAVSISIFVGSAVAFNLFNANEFRLMTQKYNETLYQIAWRAPGIKPGALIITNEQEDSNYYTHSAVKAMFNLLYPHDPSIEYDLIFSKDLALRMAREEQSQTETLQSDIINSGRSADVVAFQMTSPGCVRFVETDTPFVNNQIHNYGFETVSNPEVLIATGKDDIQLNPKFALPEPAHGWCYYFEKPISPCSLRITLPFNRIIRKWSRIHTIPNWITSGIPSSKVSLQPATGILH